MKLRLSLQAIADLENILAYVARDSPRAAAEIVRRIEDFRMISEHPEAGRAAGCAGRRVIGVPRLPYLIYYRRVGDEVQIVSVRHGKRRRPRLT